MNTLVTIHRMLIMLNMVQCVQQQNKREAFKWQCTIFLKLDIIGQSYASTYSWNLLGSHAHNMKKHNIQNASWYCLYHSSYKAGCHEHCVQAGIGPKRKLTERKLKLKMQLYFLNGGKGETKLDWEILMKLTRKETRRGTRPWGRTRHGRRRWHKWTQR